MATISVSTSKDKVSRPSSILIHPIIYLPHSLTHSLNLRSLPPSLLHLWRAVHMTKARDNDCHFVFVKEELDHAGCVAIKDLHHGHFLE